MMTAHRIDAYVLQATETLPDGVKVIVVTCPDFDALTALPMALYYRGEIYGRTGWNSDTQVAYYRSDAEVAYVR